MVLQRVIKPKNQRVKRALEAREPKLHENDKNALLLRGGRTSELITQVLKEFHMLKKPLSIMYQKKNVTRPFEDQTSIEFFAKKSDASLFMFGSHSKKRPNNLVLGRMFDYHVLDMIELGVDKYTPMKQFEGAKCTMGTKPCLLFAGEAFDTDTEYKRLKSLLTDFFRGPKVENIRLSGIEHVYQFTAIDGKVLLRSYRIHMKKSGSRTPRIELTEMGPSLDLNVRRTHLASDDLFKRACRQPKEAKPKKKKNVTRDVFGTKKGTIHMTPQDLTKLQTRKMKGLKRKSLAGENQEESDKPEDTDPEGSTPPKKARKGKDAADNSSPKKGKQNKKAAESPLQKKAKKGKKGTSNKGQGAPHAKKPRKGN